MSTGAVPASLRDKLARAEFLLDNPHSIHVVDPLAFLTEARRERYLSRADAVLSTLRDWLAREREQMIEAARIGVDIDGRVWRLTRGEAARALDAALASLTSEEGEQK